MALAKKLSTEATTKTHGEVDASIVDILNPLVPLDSTGSMIRTAAHGALVWLARGYSENKTIGF